MENKKVVVCRKFGLLNFTVQNIWKNITNVISAFERSGLRIKQFRKPEPSYVNMALLKWFEHQRSDSVIVSSLLLTIIVVRPIFLL
jgi:hypothetical protein